MSFTGEFHHTVDTKGRLIVPSRLRDELDGDRVVLVAGPDHCIEMWSGEGWRDYETKLLEQRRNNPDSRAAIRFIAASAHTDEVDRQGRMSIPQNLRSYADIERDVVVCGALNHCEIWSPHRYEHSRASVGQEGGLSELVRKLEL